MNLPSDIIEQFVKVTNDKQDLKIETTVYGTIVELNSTKFVKIDGSDFLTPISTTANVKAGERVTVMIKNHTAIVTGNITSPAARVQDVEGLESADEKIKQFEKTLNTATDKIKAIENDIDTLQTHDLEITEIISKLQYDSGWQPLQFQNGVTQNMGELANAAKYRKIRNKVYVIGTVDCTYNGSDPSVITVLPVDYRPTSINSVSTFAEADGSKIASIQILKDGSVSIQRVIDLSNGTMYTGSTWIDMNIEFFID